MDIDDECSLGLGILFNPDIDESNARQRPVSDNQFVHTCIGGGLFRYNPMTPPPTTIPELEGCESAQLPIEAPDHECKARERAAVFPSYNFEPVDAQFGYMDSVDGSGVFTNNPFRTPRIPQFDASALSFAQPIAFVEPDGRTENPEVRNQSSNRIQNTRQPLERDGKDGHKCDHCDTWVKRKYDLERHRKEQHKCYHPSCHKIFFESPKVQEAHLSNEHKWTREMFKCGRCGKRVMRDEKLKQHLVKFHQMEHGTDIALTQCTMVPCFLGEGIPGGVYFPSPAELTNHLQSYHLPGASIPQMDQGTAEDPTAEVQSEQRVENAIGPSQVEKRHLDHLTESDRKRCKHGSAADSACDLAEDSQGMDIHENCPTQTQSSTSSFDSEENLPMPIIYLHYLRKDYEMNNYISNLKSSSIHAFFNAETEMFKLRSSQPREELQEAKTWIKNHITMMKPIKMLNCMDEPSLQSKHVPTAQNPISRSEQGQIEPIDPKRDAYDLTSWNNLLPELPGLLKANIGPEFSASLVRSKATTNSSSAMIRIQSPGSQRDNSRNKIKERIRNFFDKHRRRHIPVRFYDGYVQALAVTGADEVQEEDAATLGVQDDPPSDRRQFPQQRRYWEKPGMGASIGMTACSRVSATLGGYIVVEGELHILSVDHFVRETLKIREITKSNVSSPSPADIIFLKKILKQKFEDLKQQLGDEAPPGDIPFSESHRLFSDEITREITYFTRCLNDLSRTPDAYEMGVLRCRSDHSSLRTSKRTRSVEEPHRMDSHRMDWSVFSVNKNREGKNYYRHGLNPDPGLQDFENEPLNPFGLGDLCHEVERIVGGENVHYFGQSSGLRHAKMSAAKVLVHDSRGASYEWAMVVQSAEQEDVERFRGDSGAWVIGEDNKLRGMLWGWEKCQLILTPIQELFDDIQERLNVDRVCLPSKPSRSLPRSQDAVAICRIDEDNAPGTPKEDDAVIDAELPQPLKGIDRRSASPVPSLSSAASTPSAALSPGPASPDLPPLRIPELSSLTNNLTIASEAASPSLGWNTPQDVVSEELTAKIAERSLRKSFSLESFQGRFLIRSQIEKSATWPSEAKYVSKLASVCGYALIP